jgi:hypothetical protein
LIANIFLVAPQEIVAVSRDNKLVLSLSLVNMYIYTILLLGLELHQIAVSETFTYLLLGWEVHQITVSEMFTYCWAGSSVRSQSVKCLLTAGLGAASDLGQ